MRAVAKKTESITIRVDPDFKARLEAVAKAMDCSSSWLARQYVARGLEEDEKRGAGRRRSR
jgi:predicted transcriptional regulator